MKNKIKKIYRFISARWLMTLSIWGIPTRCERYNWMIGADDIFGSYMYSRKK